MEHAIISIGGFGKVWHSSSNSLRGVSIKVRMTGVTYVGTVFVNSTDPLTLAREAIEETRAMLLLKVRHIETTM